MKYLVHLCRTLVGVLFIISGLIKSNDTIGFAYKLEEYYQVFGTEFLISTAVLQAMVICIVEVVLGVMLLIGYRKKLTLFLLMAMIVFFTFLTFYSAYFNKVTDCGCFGDALHLTPWQSFGKDVALLILISVLVAGSKHIQQLFSNKVTLGILSIALILNIAFPVYTYNYMPVKDFRPYAIGNDIIEQMNGGRPGKFDTRFVYKNLQTGKDEEMVKPPYTDTINWEIDTLKWKFVDTKQIVLDPGEQAPIHDFSITSVEGSEYTDDFLKHDSLHFFLVSYDLTKADRDVQPQINAFAQACEKNGIPFIGLSSSTPEAIDEFRHEVQAPYDYYITDATQLKTMIRSNPGLILLKGSKILDMWGKRTLPTFEDFRKKYPNNK
ncbi:MAG TPA: DoxX family membrane protein [Flavobacteriales bacterium]|nr:DoxX family membrane protein [Flavobacteriales bacterium]